MVDITPLFRSCQAKIPLISVSQFPVCVPRFQAPPPDHFTDFQVHLEVRSLMVLHIKEPPPGTPGDHKFK